MYVKPRLEKFGGFRQLTQVGFNGASDGGLIAGMGQGNPSGDQSTS